MPILIGIGHRSNHGKDTLADYLVNAFAKHAPAWRVQKQPWAWKGKEICSQMYAHLGMREPEFYETDEGRPYRNIKLPHINLTPVEIWIKVLSHGIRDHCWDRTWVEYLLNKKTVSKAIIVPDTRFPIEVSCCTYTIKCTNPRILNREGLSVDDELADYDDWTYYVSNDGTKDDLVRKATHLCEELIYSIQTNRTSQECREQGPNRF